MRKTKFLIRIIILSTLITQTNIAQNYGTGVILNDMKFEISPKAPPLSRGDFVKLPEVFSLKRFTPKPGDQGSSSTCSGWSISYNARTILEAINNNWNSETINMNTFSPSYLYNQIRPQDGCEVGTSLVDGFELITNEGVLPYTEFGYDCERVVKKEDKERASDFKLKEYREIISRKSKNKTLNIKKSLSQSKPVVIGFNCPKSFYTAKDVWHPKKDEYEKNFSGHALTIIGFDDNVEGGSFEILNSWGENWGNEGFIWMRYSDLDHFGVWGAELISEPKLNNKKNINADIFLQKYQNDRISIQRNFNSFETVDTFLTGTKFQLFLTNKSPAYLYIFSYDKTKGIDYLYPMNSLVSDYLAYSENNIILPSEGHTFELDDDSGVSSLVIIISTESVRTEIDKFLDSERPKSKLNELIEVLANEERKVSFDTENNVENIITINRENENDFISMVNIDIFHYSKEEE